MLYPIESSVSISRVYRQYLVLVVSKVLKRYDIFYFHIHIYTYLLWKYNVSIHVCAYETSVQFFRFASAVTINVQRQHWQHIVELKTAYRWTPDIAMLNIWQCVSERLATYVSEQLTRFLWTSGEVLCEHLATYCVEDWWASSNTTFLIFRQRSFNWRNLPESLHASDVETLLESGQTAAW